jgi:cation-transporting ATPase I
LALARDIPRFRKKIDESLGRDRAQLALNLAVAASQALTQRPLNALVDSLHKTTRLREVTSQQQVWKERSDELFADPPETPWQPRPPVGRPRPLPKGPIEDYADRAWFISLGGFAVSFLATGSMQRAAAALFGTLPKPARLGREVFTAELGRQLARRGLLVLDRERLRLFDRVDCLVVQGDLVNTQHFLLGPMAFSSTASADKSRQVIIAMFDASAPLAEQRQDSWRLAPLGRFKESLRRELRHKANQWSDQGCLTLALAKRRSVVALAQVQVAPETGIEELIAAAHQAHMRVVVTAPGPPTEGLQIDDIISPKEGLLPSIRRLQKEGRVVCLVGTGASPGLAAADVGLGVIRPGEPVPWGAHVICHHDLTGVHFMLHACVTARRLAKQSVNVALTTATMGAIVSAGGLVPMTPQRAMGLVNAATLVAMVNAERHAAVLRRNELPQPRDPTPWHALTARGALTQLKSTREGLNRKEAHRRRGARETAPGPLAQLAEAITDELFNPFAPLLAAGAGLAALVGSTADAGVVAGVVALNSLVGGVQRFRAERAINVLARGNEPPALVRREGTVRRRPVDKLVVGDIVLLNAGDVVPADCRIVDAAGLEVDASSLTGESLPVPKDEAPSLETHIPDRRSMLYQGTSIAAGQATAVVVAVGRRTEAHRGATGPAGLHSQGGVEQRLRSLMHLTGPVALGAGLGVVAAGLMHRRQLEEVIGSGVSLAVAAVPEGLPLLATAAQLAAAERLSRRGVLVRNVRSIEGLGRVDIICLDKTGTITEGSIQLRLVSDGITEHNAGENVPVVRRLLAAALRATAESSTTNLHADPTDQALYVGAAAVGVGPEYEKAQWQRRQEVPFEAGRGYNAILADTAEGPLWGIKGSPEVLLPHCVRWRRRGEWVPLDEPSRQFLAAEVQRLGQQGLRVLVVAEAPLPPPDQEVQDPPEDLTFCGFLAFSDPVRRGAPAALRRLQQTGVQVVMLTGDHPGTAAAIAAEAGLASNCAVVTGADISAVDNDELPGVLSGTCIIARATPSQKARIVRTFQRQGRVVAMVGDGANDAPAIRLADVGIAVGQSTAAARDAADVVLTDGDIAHIADAVVEGRAVWASVKKAVSVLIGGNLGEIGYTWAAGLVDGRPPLNARQLLLVNLVTDAAPAMAVALRTPAEVSATYLAEEGPEASLGRPLDREILTRAIVTALGAGSAWSVGGLVTDPKRAATMGLVALVGSQLGQTLVAGGHSWPVLGTTVGSAAALFYLIQTPGVSHFFGCRPLRPLEWAATVAAAGGAAYLASAAPRAFEAIADRLHQEIKRVPLGESRTEPEGAIDEEDSIEANQPS